MPRRKIDSLVLVYSEHPLGEESTQKHLPKYLNRVLNKFKSESLSTNFFKCSWVFDAGFLLKKLRVAVMGFH
jgi:hypothetical protein